MKYLKNTIFILFIAAICTVFTGCAIFSHKEYTFTYPSDIKERCYDAKQRAKDLIQTTGDKLSTKSNSSVTKIPGERMFSGEWAWQYKPGFWVCGLCYAYGKIQVACNPKTGGDVNQLTLIHENGHYWLMSNFKDYGHNPKYKSLFQRWYDAKDATNKRHMIIEKDGEIIHIDYFLEEDFIDTGVSNSIVELK